ncbi:amidohydrolase [Desulfovibrio sp. OttesenSCG-928-I05]|nr:amidohydrolase [Desulfovibrio sp. OttesenSCG-928-I05]
MSKQSILDWIDANHGAFDELALTHWNNPEIAFEEKESARLQMEFMKARGFTISQKEGMPTAFMAEWGSGSPVIGILGEYDALAGLSQKVSAVKEPVSEGAAGHACGHNLLGVSGMLAACAAKAAFETEGKQGTIRYYGCPAEEQLTGKAVMAKLGYFDGTDLSLTWHPGDFSFATACTMTALFSAKFKFTGRAAHAGASPEAGRSALDAVEIMNIGANYLREHMVDQNRLHYVITNGGMAPNIVPAEAEVWYFARAPHSEELRSLWQRLNKVAKGAATMTETEVTAELLGGCYNTLPNKVLNGVLEENLINFAGPIPYDDKDMVFAREIQATLPEAQVTAALSKPVTIDEKDRVLAATPLPCWDEGRFMMGSSDVGDVANMMPTSFIWGATWPVGVAHHSWQAVACAGSPIGLKGQTQAAKAMAGAMYDLAEDASLVEAAKKEFTTRRGGKAYCPIEQLLD